MNQDKSQSPKPKAQRTTNSQIPTGSHLVIGFWDFVGIWDLGFGI